MNKPIRTIEESLEEIEEYGGLEREFKKPSLERRRRHILKTQKEIGELQNRLGKSLHNLVEELKK